jgi:phosphomevalonate kinase
LKSLLSSIYKQMQKLSQWQDKIRGKRKGRETNLEEASSSLTGRACFWDADDLEEERELEARHLRRGLEEVEKSRSSRSS